MRTTLACLVALFLVSTGAPEAQAACRLLAPGTSCPDLGKRVFAVDFTPDVTQKRLVPLVPEAGRRPVVVMRGNPPHSAQPIDCDMVRWVDSSLDPAIAKRPPATIDHAIRIVEVPACPAPERKVARIR